LESPAKVRLLLPRKPIEGGDRIASEKQVEFRVQRVAEVEFDDDFVGFDLSGQAAKARFVGVGGGSES
jgi:hypothetical protein